MSIGVVKVERKPLTVRERAYLPEVIAGAVLPGENRRAQRDERTLAQGAPIQADQRLDGHRAPSVSRAV